MGVNNLSEVRSRARALTPRDRNADLKGGLPSMRRQKETTSAFLYSVFQSGGQHLPRLRVAGKRPEPSQCSMAELKLGQ